MTRGSRQRRRALGLTVVGAIIALLLSACAGAAGGGARFVFSRFADRTTEPVAIQVAGLQPAETVVLTARVTTPAGAWSSRAVYDVPANGRIRLWAQEPLAAPYPSPDGAGLLWSLKGPSLSQQQLEAQWAFGAFDVRFSAEQEGRQVASAQLHRAPLAAGTTDRDVLGSDVQATGDPEASGFAPTARVGRLVDSVPTPVDLRPGVILIDGDDGGASGAFAARMIASAGFPVLVLPAFVPAGQIPGSAALSVETFDSALSWFSSLPIVDEDRIFVYGTGRASSLALWFAANDPDRIHGAFAATGATALQCTSAAGSPLLIQHGRPLPCANPERTIAGTDILPLQRISGPLVLACGTADRLLPTACDWTRAGESARGEEDGDAFLYAQNAGHDITTPPLLPIGLSDLPPATAQATETARTAFWQLVLGKLTGAVRP
ncbi:acyl-CoA thioesterase/BAAT N-terminal domain-containing protein [Leifsonia sp. fls2-241-R2A-40a]|uniref:acyl-CoA thioesterase/bile acid-CoA:amino acid N-acyltransferase family protein n=1 Tax=Leifsonia sp. fls2-241-R2A-40a TaxID=3040290 RepID=UPI00254BFE27|nr:acyl-CoA thioesterase/BAAT N-terminal domain-containing protein [Leifsonia sp. fls2-241-R2A-40a]